MIVFFSNWSTHLPLSRHTFKARLTIGVGKGGGGANPHYQI